MVYSIIRSKAVFYQLANLPEDSYQLVKPRGKRHAGLPRSFPGEGGEDGEDGEGATAASSKPHGIALYCCLIVVYI